MKNEPASVGEQSIEDELIINEGVAINYQGSSCITCEWFSFIKCIDHRCNQMNQSTNEQLSLW